MAEIDALIRMLLQGGGSDLHLSAGRTPLVRESGDMVALELPALTAEDTERFLFEIMPERNRKEFQSNHDTDFSYELGTVARMRVNVFRDLRGVGGVLRVIPTKVQTVEDLGLPSGITNLCYLTKGLVVVTGPTGSGKSTTLAAMVDLVNRTRREHIITIEDPIEFVHKEQKCLITQRELHSHTKSFASALRAALREDPDIVLVGEMRDLETIEIAIETAETGHLVFGTLHTTSAASAVDRIIDSFPADRQNQIRTMLASSLKGVIAQTLCRRLGRGQVAALEVMIVDRGISSLIRDAKTHQLPSAMQIGRSQGMQMLNDSLVQFVEQGIVDPAEAYMKAVDKDELLAKYSKLGIPAPDFTLGSQRKT